MKDRPMKYLKHFENTDKTILKKVYVEYGLSSPIADKQGEVFIRGRWTINPFGPDPKKLIDKFAIAVVQKQPYLLSTTRHAWDGYIISPIERQQSYSFIDQPSDDWENWDDPTPEEINTYKKLKITTRFDL